MLKCLIILLGAWAFAQAGILDALPANTWVRVASSPGDPKGREVPPGRSAGWVYEPNVHKFFRFGGTAPNFSNQLYSFDPESLKWAVVRSNDETYPANRPGGGSSVSMAYDSVRKAIWIMGARYSGYPTGDHGMWLYDAVNDTFIKKGGAAYSFAGGYHAYDPAHDLLLATPPATRYVTDGGQTRLFSPASGTWTGYSSTSTPQEYYYGDFPIVFDRSLSKFVLFRMLVEYGVQQNTRVWTFDPVSHQWAVLDSASLFPSRQFPATAYDPLNQVIFMYGGFKEVNAGQDLTETWVYKTSSKTWTQITAPGLPRLTDAVLFPQALAWDPVHACMLLEDPDLGVWAFKYDPLSPAGTTVLNAEALVVGKAAANTPAPGAAEASLKSYPSPLNQRLLGMADNSLLILGGGAGPGMEIMWDFDPDKRVIVKYGGCTNNANSPYWAHYGNNLDIYDPGTETWSCRRVGDVGGANRPRNGCTRSVIYDRTRNEWHFFGGTGSGPYDPPYLSAYTYDIAKDSFTFKAAEGTMPLGHVGCVLSYDPDHDVTIFPDSAKTYVFSFTTGLWQTRTTIPSPGRLDVYQRTAYASSIQKFVAVQPRIIGADSLLDTWTYDPVANHWDSLTTAAHPPYRACKYGFAYDSLNDVVLMVGGQVRWGGTALTDIWAYHPKTNTWEQMNPTPVGGAFPESEAMCTSYDVRHNVFYIGSQWNYVPTMFAYRYKNLGTAGEKGIARVQPLSLLASPNPFAINCGINIRLPERTLLRVDVYNMAGQRIQNVVSGKFAQGQHRFVWQGDDSQGRKMAAGVYLVRMAADRKVLCQRVLLGK